MPEAVIVATARSPIGRANKGSMVDLRPDDLAAQTVGALLSMVPQLPPTEIEDLLLGCAQPAGESGFNIARVVAVLLGLDHLAGVTVNRFCASSLQTIRMAAHAIRAGEGDVFVAGGVETVSRFGRGTANGWPGTRNRSFDDALGRSAGRAETGFEEWVDPRGAGWLPDIYISMGQTAENVARLKDVRREDMDHFAVRSQNRAEEAARRGFWAAEISPVTLAGGRVVDTDDCPRPGTTYEAVAALKPAFQPEGRVTAGNSCPLNDGAAAVLVMSDARARELGLEPLARIVSSGVSGLSPEIMGLGPVEASSQALRRAGMTIDDIDLAEMNEAFAAQVIASQRELGLDMGRLNVNGGAIALGHPFGSTGARIATTLIHALRERDGQIGLETMCVGGGMGMAMILERLS